MRIRCPRLALLARLDVTLARVAAHDRGLAQINLATALVLWIPSLGRERLVHVSGQCDLLAAAAVTLDLGFMQMRNRLPSVFRGGETVAFH